jgi:hypothetical protein
MWPKGRNETCPEDLSRLHALKTPKFAVREGRPR